MKKILVVGDWMIDEHWITGIHRSPTSRRTGRFHYRSLHSPNSNTQSFTAAGRTASVLYKTSLPNNDRFYIVGIGFWHKDDTNVLTKLLDVRYSETQTLHKINHCEKMNIESVRPIIRAKLINIADCGSYKTITSGTTRAIRIYKHSGKNIELIERIDWELNNSHKRVRGRLTDSDNLLDYLNSNSNKKYFENIDAVIIKDFCKGVISEKLIKWLETKWKNKPWFISTKEWNPRWFEKLKDVDVRLLFIPHVAAENAIREEDLNCWVTCTGKATEEALDQIDFIDNHFSSSNRRIITVLPDNSTILIRDKLESDSNQIDGILHNNAEPSSLAIPVDLASTLFSAMTTILLVNESIELEDFLHDSLGFTQKWMLHEAERVVKPEEWSLADEPHIEIRNLDNKRRIVTERQSISINGMDKFKWDEYKQQWCDACNLEKYCVIEVNGKKKIQLWRSMTEVNNYVHFIKSKKKIIRTLIDEVTSFDPSHGKSKSYMLIAPPGSGKTYLIKSIAKNRYLQFLPFNITQMMSKADLLDCFDTIVTSQSQDRKKPILAFVDEITAQIDAQNVYGFFLSPLEERIYIRTGKAYHMDPCIWIFADTKKPNPISEPKAEDFLSRLTKAPLELKINIEENNIEEHGEKNEGKNEAQVENLYLALCLLCTQFTDIQWISEKVLKTFCSFSNNIKGRKIRQFVDSFHNIQFNRVLSKNVPTEWFDREGGNLFNLEISGWNKWLEGDLVEIEK